MSPWFAQSLSESLDDQDLRPFWAVQHQSRVKIQEKSYSLGKTLQGLTGKAWDQVLAAGGMAKLATHRHPDAL